MVTDLRRRHEGLRLKHWVNLNSIKLYNSLNVLRGETTINHAEDLRVFRTPDPKLRRRQGAQVTRRLALLHAHGLIAKVSRTHRWQVTPRGRRLITAVLAARSANTEQLVNLAT